MLKLIASLTTILALAGHGATPSSATRVTTPFEIAGDPNLEFDERALAAGQLEEGDRCRLRDFLLDRLPGGTDKSACYDKRAFDDIQVLAVVGNHLTAVALRDMVANHPRVPGQIGAAIHKTIQDIESREKKKTENENSKIKEGREEKAGDNGKATNSV